MRLVPLAALAALCTAAALAASASPPKPDAARVERGRYLVTIGGCNDCHTPWKKTATGMEPDLTRMLSGHPEELVMPPAPRLEGPWMAATSGTMTAIAGPWGISFARNLTPDEETGIGAWTEKDFVATIRNGRHMGHGRPLLPPMPWFNYAKATDEDLKAIFAYLRTIPPVKNRVEEPRPAPAATAAR